MDFGALFGLDLLGEGVGGKGGYGSVMDDFAAPPTELQDILDLSLQEHGILDREVVINHEIVSIFCKYIIIVLSFVLRCRSLETINFNEWCKYNKNSFQRRNT